MNKKTKKFLVGLGLTSVLGTVISTVQCTYTQKVSKSSLQNNEEIINKASDVINTNTRAITIPKTADTFPDPFPRGDKSILNDSTLVSIGSPAGTVPFSTM